MIHFSAVNTKQPKKNPEKQVKNNERMLKPIIKKKKKCGISLSLTVGGLSVASAHLQGYLCHHKTQVRRPTRAS